MIEDHQNFELPPPETEINKQCKRQTRYNNKGYRCLYPNCDAWHKRQTAFQKHYEEHVSDYVKDKAKKRRATFQTEHFSSSIGSGSFGKSVEQYATKKQLLQLKEQMNQMSQKMQLERTDPSFQKALSEMQTAKVISKEIVALSIDSIARVLQARLLTPVAQKIKSTSVQNVQSLVPTAVQNLIQTMTSSRLGHVFNSYDQAIERMEEQYFQSQRFLKLSAESKRKYRKALEFWKKYEFVSEANIVVVMNDMNSFGLSKQKFLRMTYEAMRSYQPSLPQLPKKLRSYLKKQIKIIRLQDVQKALGSISNRQMRADLWMCTCLGLRKSQLMRIKLEHGGKIVRRIKVWQQKNNRYSTRIVPRSLGNMILKYQASYPMTKERFAKLRKFCLDLFGRFYGLRSLCITLIVAAVSQMTPIAAFHANPRTTQRFYINQESELLIDNIFSLPEFMNDEPFCQKSLIFEPQGPPKLSNDIVGQGEEISYQLKDVEEDEFTDAMVSDLSQLEPSSLSETEKKISDFMMKYRQKHQTQIQAEIFDSFAEAVAFSLGDKRVEQLKERQQIEQFVMQNYGYDIFDVLDLESPAPASSVPIISYQDQDSEVFQCIRVDKRTQEKVISVLEEEEQGQFSWGMPCLSSTGRKCSGKEAIPYLCKQTVPFHWVVACKKCGSVYQHACCLIRSDIVAKAPKFLIQGDKLEVGFNDNIYAEQENILKQMVQRRDYEYKEFYSYSIELPEIIRGKGSVLCESDSKIVQDHLQKQRYLPYTVRQSRWGQGLFLQEGYIFPPFTLVAVYCGRVLFSSCLDANGVYNDTFEFGCVTCERLGMFLSNLGNQSILIDAHQQCNIGRFINSGKKDDLNCRSLQTFVSFRDQVLPMILIYTIKEVNSKQFAYSYGSNYPGIKKLSSKVSRKSK